MFIESTIKKKLIRVKKKVEILLNDTIRLTSTNYKMRVKYDKRENSFDLKL